MSLSSAGGVTGSGDHTSPSRRVRRAWLVAFVVVVVAQLVAVYSPGAPAGPEISGLDKVIHILIFAAPAFTGLAAGLSARWLLPLLALHAPVSEIVQWLALPHRDGDIRDVVADLVGVAVGVALHRCWQVGRR